MLATFTVTTAADAGPGSLRQAILDANGLPGADQVTFDLGGDGPHTIEVQSPLPDVTDPLILDGATQPGDAGPPRVAISGAAAGANANGLVLRAESTVRGIAIARFGGNGIVFAQGGGKIEGCYVGLLPGVVTLTVGNRKAGVVINCPGVTVGGPSDAQRNVISGNGGAGVWINGGDGATVEGNYIGTHASGSSPFQNSFEGLLVESSTGVRIGPGRNVISGNGASGVRIAASASDVTITGAYVGANAAGSAPVPNGRVIDRPYRDGITTEGRDVRIGLPNSTARNVISANPGSGVAILGGANVLIDSSYIGTDATGARALGTTETNRQTCGVRVAGGGGHRVGTDTRTTRNVISGNYDNGILIERTDGTYHAVWVSGCYIGTNAEGAAAVRNGAGVTVTASGPGSVTIGYPDGNVISGNQHAGIVTAGSLATNVQGNLIGTNDARRAALRATFSIPNEDGVVVTQGDATLVSNYVSGNQQAGARVLGGGVATFRNNRIGTDWGGGKAVPNGGNGIEIIDGLAQIGPGKNIISGNRGHGVLIGGPRARGDLFENYIGITEYGAALGNGGSGVYIAASSNSVDRNVISANGGNGITLTDVFGMPGGGNWITNNAIGTNLARSLTTPGFGNAGHGIAVLNSTSNQIGPLNSSNPTAASNVIAFNGGSGVMVDGPAADRNTISFNSIFANGGLGIDLQGDGVTPNDPLDADAGPNRLQNFPVIVGPVTALRAGTATVRFVLDSEPNRQYTVQLFSSPDFDGGHAEGHTPLGSRTVQTDAAGHAEASASVMVIPGTWLTATAIGTAGTSEFAPAVQVTGGPAVVARHIFYNNSAFDGRDPAANAADDAAIAPDKRPLMPWEFASYANVTSYTKGINGIMIDVVDLPAATTLDASDFSFRRYDPHPLGTGWYIPPGWFAVGVPAPTVSVRRGAGVGGSDRVTLTWSDRTSPRNSNEALVNEWLEVTVKANVDTGLGRPDVFFVGNLVGETGDRPSGDANSLQVSWLDYAVTRRALTARKAPLTSVADHNRDGVIDRRDLAAVQGNLTKTLSYLTPRLASPGTSVAASALPSSLLREEMAVLASS